MLEKTLILGKTEGGRREQQKMRCLDGITDVTDISLSKFQEIRKDRCMGLCMGRSARGRQESDTAEPLNNLEVSGKDSDLLAMQLDHF